MDKLLEVSTNSLAEAVLQYYNNDYNCAESLLMGANDFYHLGLTEDSCKLMGGFGGGMHIGALCGTIAAAVATISSLLITTRAHSTPELTPLTVAFWEKFDAVFPSRECNIIREQYFAPGKRCANTVIIASNILEDVITAYRNE